MTKQERLEREVKSLERKVKDLEGRSTTHLHLHADGYSLGDCCHHRHCYRCTPQFVPTPWTYPITTGGITTWSTSNVSTASDVLTVTL